MMTSVYLLLTILILTSCSEKSETIVKESYANGTVKIVHYYPDKADMTFYERKYFHPNEQIGSVGYIDKGEMTGVWDWWYQNGNPESHSIFKNGQEKDSTLCYYESGPLSRRLYQVDSINDIWFSTDYFENGQKKTETYLVGNDRIVDSIWKEWNEHGDLIQSGAIDSTQKVGLWKIRNDNDSLIIKEMDGTQTITFKM